MSPRRVQFSSINNVKTIPSVNLPERGFFRKNYPTQKLSRNMFPPGVNWNVYFFRTFVSKKPPRPATFKNSFSRKLALGMALRNAKLLSNNIRKNNAATRIQKHVRGHLARKRRA